MNATPKRKPEPAAPQEAGKGAIASAGGVVEAANENRGASLVDSMWGTADVDLGMSTDEFMAMMRGRD